MQNAKYPTRTVARKPKTVLAYFFLRCNYQDGGFGVFSSVMITQDLAAHTSSQLEPEGSLYMRVALRISELIEHGTLRAGERVPSVRRCSRQQSVSIATVMQAYRLLESRGIIEAIGLHDCGDA